MAKNYIKDMQALELQKILSGESVPHGWPSNVKFDKNAMHNGHLNLRDINILQRAILGHMVQRNKTRQLTYKNVIEEALVEYFERHKDEIL